jgi:uncharacterized protein YcbK (DUF882 family)
VKSRFFTVDEFRCHSGEPYPAAWVDDRLQALCNVLDAVRDAWDAPIIVVCGYRTAAYNAALAEASAKRNGGVSGVAQSSQHIQGRAADVRPQAPTVERVAELHAMVRRLYDSGRGLQLMGGLGLYPGWIHVDVRAKVNGHLATWGGSGMGDAQ